VTTSRNKAAVAKPLTAKKDGFHAVLEKITPEVAQEVLDTRNNNNRPIHRHHVEAMAEQIVSGDYQGLNGQTI
jgi:hypothetical protein